MSDRKRYGPASQMKHQEREKTHCRLRLSIEEKSARYGKWISQGRCGGPVRGLSAAESGSGLHGVGPEGYGQTSRRIGKIWEVLERRWNPISQSRLLLTTVPSMAVHLGMVRIKNEMKEEVQVVSITTNVLLSILLMKTWLRRRCFQECQGDEARALQDFKKL